MQIISSSKRTIILIICGAILGFILLQWAGETTQHTDESALELSDEAPDYFMRNFTVITTRENGEVFQRLTGEELNHYKTGLTQIEKPKLKLNTEKETVWQASANHGTVINQTELTLDGKVSIEQTNNMFKQIHIATKQLTLNMQSNTAESNSLVTVTTDNGVIRANAMFADLEQQYVQLFSGVKAEYVSK